jgi:hypothetical protein
MRTHVSSYVCSAYVCGHMWAADCVYMYIWRHIYSSMRTQVSSYVCWRMQAADVCWRMQVADVCWRMQVVASEQLRMLRMQAADVCWRMLTDAGWRKWAATHATYAGCWRMLTYAGCWRMLTYADGCRLTQVSSDSCTSRDCLDETHFFQGTKVRILTHLLVHKYEYWRIY